MLDVSWDKWLVLISLLIAFIASFTALDTAGRVASSQGWKARFWLAGGGTAMGIGVWSMHFIGMLAMKFPMPMHYSIGYTGVSLLLVIVASIVALQQVVSQQHLGWERLTRGALLLGSGIVGMHYLGMYALLIDPGIVWDRGMVILSIVIAYVASGVALWLAFELRKGESGIVLRRLQASLVMGFAIAGMHYVGMDAASFKSGSHMYGHGINSPALAIWVFLFTLSILGCSLLVSMIDSQIKTTRLAKKLHQANRELHKLAMHDPLTLLPNRAYLEEQLDHYIQGASSGSAFALMFLDLDGFKMINDAYGHHIGDRLLIMVTERLKNILDSDHVLARVGGDEFVLLTPSTSAEMAERIAAGMVKAIEKPFHISDYELMVSISIGIALYPPHGSEGRDMMFNADVAMYHTKNNGRNGFSVYRPDMNPMGKSQVQLKNELWRALYHNELRLFYQPKNDAGSGQIIGYEALVRWQHPVRGLLSPDKFLPVAEKSGMIIQVGEWVLNEACRQLAIWHAQGNTELSVSVNLSALQFEQEMLAQVVLNALTTNNVPPEKMILEITETTAMRSPKETIRILNILKEHGIQVSIDDFGTGYSSLLYLQSIPASELKIDRAFVREINNNHTDTRLLAMIIELAKNMNLNIVAEGVETEEQQRQLTELGCNILQGFYFSRPVPPEQLVLPEVMAKPHAQVKLDLVPDTGSRKISA
ncbi:putative bifunctional diguanylate cyclase/phosphodiesterase [Tatumella ptyseos]|uniref:Diguanylate cyclase/phosphodiesterase n=1 Tax=Tatumella ptyseos ATCC 33301 TaxID=1005995 RepID=A0A085J9C4_9GAMM|nr:bifunctional diguanylate cyclase/phosphodiesterase [Tatumella ptyseos]KFD17070.1 diguanylate cyclase/phosphodiesterase [Tatumella ptyseos ATCC 33301]